MTNVFKQILPSEKIYIPCFFFFIIFRKEPQALKIPASHFQFRVNEWYEKKKTLQRNICLAF